jgi:hypothetical protein
MPCHAMHPIQDLFLESFFHINYNWICTPICTKILFLQKVGVTEDEEGIAGRKRRRGYITGSRSALGGGGRRGVACSHDRGPILNW